MTSYKEIVTKAIIGKTKKTINADYEFSIDQKPDTILGCWVINHHFKGSLNNKEALISGDFDINVWYSYDNDTKTAVYTQNYSYNDTIQINAKVSGNEEIAVNCLKQPTVLDVKINDGLVKLKVEKIFGVELIGNTTVKVASLDEVEDYEEVFDSPKDEELNINVDNINENYIAVNK